MLMLWCYNSIFDEQTSSKTTQFHWKKRKISVQINQFSNKYLPVCWKKNIDLRFPVKMCFKNSPYFIMPQKMVN